MQPAFEDYLWLISDAAEPYLAASAATATLSPAAIARLRRQLSAERVHLVVELSQLRRRARRKFSRAEAMFFTKQGLEQATDEAVAGYKARRLLDSISQAGRSDSGTQQFQLADLCCGIGGDLLGLMIAGAKNVLAVDADPVATLFASANIRAYESQNCAHISTGDAASAPVESVAAWHIDPDRRATGRRATKLAAFSPSLEQLQSLVSRNDNVGIKLAPATDLPADWQEEMEREWIGYQGECRQQIAWGGCLAQHPGHRVATVLAPQRPSANAEYGYGRPQVRTVAFPSLRGESHRALAKAPSRYVYEPHAAVLAAGVEDALAAEHGLLRTSPAAAYYTSEMALRDPALAAFEVLDVLPFKTKALQAWLAEREFGMVEVKKRGVAVDPLELQRQLQAKCRGKGPESVAVIIAPCPAGIRAILARRLPGELPTDHTDGENAAEP